jgi:hypothetical protein
MKKNIISESDGKVIYAKDLKCKCGAKAVCFYPVIDPDIKPNPYCEKCLRVSQVAMMNKLKEINDKYDNEQE